MTTLASEAATPSRCPATALAWAAGIAMIAASNGPLRCGPCSDSMASTHTSCSVRSTRVTVTSVRIVNPAARFLNSEDIPGVPTNHCEAGPDEAAMAPAWTICATKVDPKTTPMDRLPPGFVVDPGS
ncbi:MAG: hypothetical protein EB140_09965 [Proteobacteria bacterium]|nr:hypothetical protein [Pseudomonadota bacterium]